MTPLLDAQKFFGLNFPPRLREEISIALAEGLRARLGERGRLVLLAGGGVFGEISSRAAALLRGELQSRIFLYRAPAGCSPDSSQSASGCLSAAMGPAPAACYVPLPEPAYLASLTSRDILLDATFGARGAALPDDLIAAWNASAAAKIALGCPCGVDPATGQILSPPLRAGATFTLGGGFPGDVLYPGAEEAGERFDFPLPRALASALAGSILALDDLPPRPPCPPRAHKGSCGTVALLAGSSGEDGAPRYTGAAYFAGLSAYRTGAGLVKILTPAANEGALARLLPEAVVFGYEDAPRPALLRDFLAGADAVAAGPGLGRSAACARTFFSLIDACSARQIPLVLDADALNLLSECLPREDLRGFFAKMPVLLTPHPGEAVRLLTAIGDAPSEVPDILAAPFAACRRIALATGASVILKDAHTVICAGERTFVNLTGCPALATAGSGDCLTGAIAALLAAGESIPDAAARGAYLHGLAGERAARRVGSRAVLARDIANALGEVE